MRFVMMVAIAIFLQGIIFMSQQSLLLTAQEAGVTPPEFATDGGLTAFMNSFNSGSGSNYSIDSESYTTFLPSTDASSIAGTFFFPFYALLNWIAGAVSFILAFLMAFHNLLVAMALPAYIIFFLDFCWYVIGSIVLLMQLVK